LSEPKPTGEHRLRPWAAIGLLVLCLILLSVGGDELRQALRYERAAIARGEYWRFLTAHLVHAGWRHLLLNAAGLLLIAALFPRDYRWRQWCLIALASIVAIDAGFWWLEPQLAWYVGLSGVLHGALAAGAVAWWRTESPWLAGSLSLILIGKLAWEQWHGALPLSGEMPVIVNAHLYGAIGGLIAGLMLQRRSLEKR
jgi:rhomboid family GlyGly-CTERM serine protease